MFETMPNIKSFYLGKQEKERGREEEKIINE